MNEICIVLYVNALYSQHLLNKPLTNRESNKLMLFPSQLFFSIVENLLRVYDVYYQYGYIIINQFNKKTMSFLYTKSLNFEKTVKNNEKIILIYN